MPYAADTGSGAQEGKCAGGERGVVVVRASTQLRHHAAAHTTIVVATTSAAGADNRVLATRAGVLGAPLSLRVAHAAGVVAIVCGGR